LVSVLSCPRLRWEVPGSTSRLSNNFLVGDFIEIDLSRTHRMLVVRRVSIKAVKQSTVSTGNLKAFQPVQLRPINRVVYPGSLAQ
jgi:hypothetical protein